MSKIIATPTKISVTKKPKSVTIKWYPNPTVRINQMYDRGLQYSFVSSNYEQCFPWVFCKDFLQDALMATHHQIPIEIYNFKYNPKTDPAIDLNRTRLSIQCKSDKNFESKISGMLQFVRAIEQKMKLIRTTAISIKNGEGSSVLLESSNRWMLSPPMISMYTLLIRTGFVHKFGDDPNKTIENLMNGKIKGYYGQHDQQFWVSGKSAVDKILNEKYAHIFYKDAKRNFPNINVATMHHYMGIVSFKEYDFEQRKYVKHWHRKKKKTDAAKDKDSKSENK